jgi:V8-like Glu-specific endopeptidase
VLLSAAAGAAVAAVEAASGGVLSAVIIGAVMLRASTSPVDAYATEHTQHTLQKDRRVIADRLNPRQNPGQRDYSFLNAVGAVWPYPVYKTGTVQKTGAGFAASTGDDAATGFMIDHCHVLTAMHVVYADDLVVHPALERAVAFAVGQTASGRDHGALQGLRFLQEGIVIAHGDALMLGGMIHNPADDWALIRLDGNVDGSIGSLAIGAVEPSKLPKGFGVSLAGYPSDHRASRGDGFKFKDLWLSEGTVVDITSGDWTAALIRTTVQTTPGNSGGPLFGDFNGRPIVIGLAQSLSGNGIDVSDSSPNVQVLFTTGTLGRIAAAQAQYPCQ